jgi:hypothetical protein
MHVVCIGGEGECIQNFDGRTRKKATSRMIYTSGIQLFFFRLPKNVIFFQLCTSKVVGV